MQKRQAKNVPLGQKRKRGRPCNAVLGLSDNEEEFELEDNNMELTEESLLSNQIRDELHISQPITY